jgi:hypothetical protein
MLRCSQDGTAATLCIVLVHGTLSAATEKWTVTSLGSRRGAAQRSAGNAPLSLTKPTIGA